AGLGATQRRSILPVAERRGFRARYRVRHAAVVGGVGARQSQSRAVSDARLAAEAAVEQHGARHGLGRIPDVVVAILAVLPTAVAAADVPLQLESQLRHCARRYDRAAAEPALLRRRSRFGARLP